MVNNLKEIMEQKGYSIDYFSKMADVTATTVQNWRKAENMKLKTKQKIAKLLKVDFEDIFKM